MIQISEIKMKQFYSCAHMLYHQKTYIQKLALSKGLPSIKENSKDNKAHEH